LPHPTANPSTAKPDEGSLALTEEIMRARAYRFFEKRGYEHGHDLEDWLRAKAEIFGKKPAAEGRRYGRREQGGGSVKKGRLET